MRIVGSARAIPAGVSLVLTARSPQRYIWCAARPRASSPTVRESPFRGITLAGFGDLLASQYALPPPPEEHQIMVGGTFDSACARHFPRRRGRRYTRRQFISRQSGSPGARRRASSKRVARLGPRLPLHIASARKTDASSGWSRGRQRLRESTPRRLAHLLRGGGTNFFSRRAKLPETQVGHVLPPGGEARGPPSGGEKGIDSSLRPPIPMDRARPRACSGCSSRPDFSGHKPPPFRSAARLGRVVHWTDADQPQERARRRRSGGRGVWQHQAPPRRHAGRTDWLRYASAKARRASWIIRVPAWIGTPREV
jgi:hypothetical protein